MKYEDIAAVNDKIKRVPIHGNEYATVAARVHAFRKICPDCQISVAVDNLDPIITYDENGVEIRRQRVVRAEAFVYEHRDDENYLANNVAEEIEGSSTINKSSFVENAITSAVGRALALCGIGSTDDIASAEEVINAQGYDTISKEKAKILKELIATKKGDEKYICKYHGVKSLEEMTTKQYAEVVKYLDRSKH